MHKQGPESGPAMWASELGEFFDWLLHQIEQGANQPPDRSAGNKDLRRQLKRGIRSSIQRFVKAYPLAPALQGPMLTCLDALRHLYDGPDGWHTKLVNSTCGCRIDRVWRDHLGLQQHFSVHHDRLEKERMKELLCVAWMIAPVIGAGNRYDCIKKNLAAKDNCQESSIDERVRRFREGLDYRELVFLVETYFKEFKVEKFLDDPETSTGGGGYEQITALTESEIDSISKTVSRGRRLRSRGRGFPTSLPRAHPRFMRRRLGTPSEPPAT